jgi:hypothetical protein
MHRGVGLHAFQPQERIETVVKPAIDAVFGISDPATLAAYAADAANPPEARLFAGARVEAAWQLAAEGRALRPNVDLELLRATTAGVDSLNWVDPYRYCSLFDCRQEAVPREVALP